MTLRDSMRRILLRTRQLAVPKSGSGSKVLRGGVTRYAVEVTTRVE